MKHPGLQVVCPTKTPPRLHRDGARIPVLSCRGGTGCTDPLDPVWMQSTPVQSLLTPHGPAVDQCDALDAQHFPQQPVLCCDIVEMEKGGRSAVRKRVREVAWAARKTVTKLVRYEDTITFRIKNAARADQPVNIGMLSAVGCRIEDQV